MECNRTGALKSGSVKNRWSAKEQELIHLNVHGSAKEEEHMRAEAQESGNTLFVCLSVPKAAEIVVEPMVAHITTIGTNLNLHSLQCFSVASGRSRETHMPTNANPLVLFLYVAAVAKWKNSSKTQFFVQINFINKIFYEFYRYIFAIF